MSNMALDGYTFEKNPTNITATIEVVKNASYVSGFDGTPYEFRWTDTILGKEIPLEWNLMSNTMFAALQAKYVMEGTLVWDPQDGTGRTFNVAVVPGFDPGYFVKFGADSYRKDVKMSLKIMSEVEA